MSWLDSFRLAARELRRRSGRAALTVLAVALAAALLTALLAIGGTAKTRVLSQISHGGSVAGITVEPNYPNGGEATLDDPIPGPPNPLTAAAVARIARLGDVSSVYAVEEVPIVVAPPGGAPPLYTSAFSANLAHVGSLPITLLAGRLPLPGSTGEVDVGSGYLDSLGVPLSKAATVVGTHLALEATGILDGFAVTREAHVEIVGVVDQQLGEGDVLGWPSVTSAVAGFEAEVAGGSSGSGSRGGDGSPSDYAGAVVVARQLGEVATVRQQIAVIGYSTAAPVGLIVSVSRYLHVVELVLSGIGFVALAIAALGIANALFAAVRERRREIAILKAIGARNRDVRRIFLLEASVVGLSGGVLGTLAGLGMAAAISGVANSYLESQGLAGVALSVPWLLPVGTVAGAVVLALAAGVLPAMRAAGLAPREAVDV